MKYLFYLNKYFWKYKFRLFLGLLFVIINNIFGVLPPQVIRYAFDLVKENITYYQLYEGFELQTSFYNFFSGVLIFFGIAVLVLALIKGIFMFLMRQTIIVMSRLIEFDLRNEVYNHYQNLSTAFYKRNRTGDMMSRVTEDISRVRMYLGPAIMYTVNLTFLIIIVVTTMLRVNATLTFYVLLPLPILSFSIYYVNSIIHKRSEIIQAQLSEITNVAQESFSGIRVLKAYIQEKATNSFFEKESEAYKNKSLDLVKVQALFMPLIMLLVGLSTIITIVIGGFQVINGSITAGNIAEFVIYVAMLTWPVMSIGWVAALIQRASASQKRINEFLEIQPTIVSPTEKSLTLQGSISFDKVSFTYPDTGIKALQNVSFSLKPGEKMAIIGRTGSGKSTIAELLVRKYDVASGSIQVDGQDIRKVNLADLRNQIGYVPQDVFLFSETVVNNIAFGHVEKEVTDKLIRHSAQQAAVLKDIEGLPHTFSTVVGERGVTLSGGQKQRISLARALIKDPQILLLDDCLSAVDATTEHTIISNLNGYLSDKTALIITHRIFSLMNFDKIIVLEDGKVIEMGSHNSLLAKKGAYYELYEKQHIEDKKVAL